jgi:hypothetical protein
MSEQFIGENIKPLADSFDTRLMTQGIPGLPHEFIWRKEKVLVNSVLKSWRTTGCCRHGSGEQYARRQWFEVQTNHGLMKIYFDRGSPGRTKEMGWRIFSLKT